MKGEVRKEEGAVGALHEMAGVRGRRSGSPQKAGAGEGCSDAGARRRQEPTM